MTKDSVTKQGAKLQRKNYFHKRKWFWAEKNGELTAVDSSDLSSPPSFASFFFPFRGKRMRLSSRADRRITFQFSLSSPFLEAKNFSSGRRKQVVESSSPASYQQTLSLWLRIPNLSQQGASNVMSTTYMTLDTPEINATFEDKLGNLSWKDRDCFWHSWNITTLSPVGNNSPAHQKWASLVFRLPLCLSSIGR